MAILTMPTTPGIRASTFGLVSNTTIFESPLNGAVQTLEQPGAYWTAVYQLPKMPRLAMVEWQTFQVQLRGQANRFYGFDPDATQPRGTAHGAPIVDGAGQTGNLLLTRGWAANQLGALLKGDYFQIDAAGKIQLCMVTADFDTDSVGAGTIQFEPPIRQSPDNASAIVTDNPKCVMMLEEQSVSWASDYRKASVNGQMWPMFEGPQIIGREAFF